MRRFEIDQASEYVEHVDEFGCVLGKPVIGLNVAKRPLPAPTLAALKRHRARQLEHRLTLGEAWQDHNLVTTSPLGTPVAPASARKTWHSLRRRLGLATVRLHDLRHTYASLLMAAGVSPRVVQERLGHSSVTMTLGTYSHTTPALHADATLRLEQLLRAAECQQNASDEPDASATSA